MYQQDSRPDSPVHSSRSAAMPSQYFLVPLSGPSWLMLPGVEEGMPLGVAAPGSLWLRLLGQAARSS